MRTQTLEAYGHGLHAAQFEEPAVSLSALSRAVQVRLQGRTFMVLDEPGEPDPQSDLALFPADTRVVIVACACSMTEGVIRIEWGSAELRTEDRHLLWHHHEPLALPSR
ncbi:hypothetical protein [Streptomyces sp. KL110A]|uniref:hypothetical protein n=1 Tax=Streptomyces sp. KL110A TaxID=3384221 RepID=UPI0038C8DAD7